jgi:transposase
VEATPLRPNGAQDCNLMKGCLPPAERYTSARLNGGLFRKETAVNQFQKVSHMSVDHHRKFGRLTARDSSNRILFRERLDYADRQKLRERLGSYPAGTPVIIEASFGWGWLADELKAAELDPHLSSAPKVAAWRKARGIAKNNRLDADLLSELWPERPRWWEVWLVPSEIRNQRELLRYRMSLVQTQTRIKNRIHAALHRHGILHPFSDLFCVKGRRWLKDLLDGDRLGDLTRLTMRGDCQLLEQVRRQIARATEVLRRVVVKCESARLWKSLPGVGVVLAHTIDAETGEAGRFSGVRCFCKYALLAPLADDSGDEDSRTPKGRHIGQQGRRTLKWALIEAAHGAVRKDELFKAQFNRITQNGTFKCNHGYIAVARKLACVGLGCVKSGRPYSVVPPARPGSAPVAAPPQAAPAICSTDPRVTAMAMSRTAASKAGSRSSGIGKERPRKMR